MADTKPSRPFHETLVTPPLLERRLWAATIDMALVLACAFAFFHSFGPLSNGPRPWLWRPAAILLAIGALIEFFTGMTLGKTLTRLAVRRRDGGPPAFHSLALRAAVKYLPVAVFLVSLLFGSFGFLFVAVAAFTLAIMEVQGCYLAIMRSGLTLFDHLAGTKVVKIEKPGAPSA
jgi:uncharacterized RDD family membrane protein YckC